MRILYLHGLYSRPGGVKPTFLSRHGHELLNPHLPDDDFPESVLRAREAMEKGEPEVVVGSSRGGAVALALGEAAARLPHVLIAPAWRRWGTARTAPPHTLILHSEADGVIAIDDSRDLLAASGLPGDRLMVVGLDHDMTDPDAFAALLSSVHAAYSLVRLPG